MHTVVPVILLALSMCSAVSAQVQDDSGSRLDDNQLMDRALALARDGDYSFAEREGARLISERPSNWHGWYVLSLTQKHRGLEAAERTALESLPLEQREVIRGMLAYAGASREERGALARDLASRHPDSVVSHLLLASALLAERKPDLALVHGRIALEKEPQLALAARAIVEALRTPSAQPSQESCIVVHRFPNDSIVSERGMSLCHSVPDPSVWADAAEAVLRTHRADVRLSQFLRSILDEPAPSAVKKRVLLGGLDPEDSRWWPHGANLFEAVCPLSAKYCDDSTREFALHTAHAVLASDADRDEALESAILAASRGNSMRGQSIDLLRRGIRALPALRSVRLRDHLAALLCADGRRSESVDSAIQAAALASPGTASVHVDACGETRDVATASIRPSPFDTMPTLHLWRPSGARSVVSEGPVVLIFWRPDCAWCRRALPLWAKTLYSPLSPVRIHGASVLWLVLDGEFTWDSAELIATEAGIPASDVWRVDGADLHDRRLRIQGTPTLLVVNARGEVTAELAGFRDADIANDIDVALRGDGA